MKFTKVYLLLLPFMSLIGMVVSGFRIAFQINFIQLFLTANLLLDFVLILSNISIIRKKIVLIFIYILTLCLVVGLINNPVSRRFVTDFFIPLFFICKVYIFKSYWLKNNFMLYVEKYSKIAFWGSFMLVPFIYYLFALAGASRISIFPPIELPFINYLIKPSIVLVFASLLIIMLYGKRAQLFSGILVLIFVLYKSLGKNIIKYVLYFIILFFIGVLTFSQIEDLSTIRRINSTMDLIMNDGLVATYETAGGDRMNEIIVIFELMNFEDFFFGKGLGFYYFVEINNEMILTANAHFTPVGLISKYGIIFTIVIYWIVLAPIFGFKRKSLKSSSYIISYGVVLFVFFESFLSYSLFVTSILPVCLGVLKNKFIYSQNNIHN